MLILVVVVGLVSCKNSSNKTAEQTYQCPMKCEGEKTYTEAGSCAVCKMDLELISEPSSKKIATDKLSDESIFNLTTNWNTQNGEVIQLEDLKGKTLVMVMIYTSCKAACPRLVSDMRNIEKEIPANLLPNVNFVFVSIDPETDTPEKLKSFAVENFMESKHWTFLQGSVAGVREFANVLSVKYKEISPLDFSHSNIISVFNSGGELVHQQEGLGVDNKETISKIIETTK